VWTWPGGGVLQQEQHAALVPPVWVESERKVLGAPGVWRREGRCDPDLIVMFAASGA
jgi:hypothetical protein